MTKFWWGALALSVLAVGCSGGDSASGTSGGTTPAKTAEGGSGSGGTGQFAGVQAILSPKCGMCHGENGKEGLDVRTYDSLMKGSEHGAIVVAGDPANSKLIHALRGRNGVPQMPKNSPPLSEDEIKKIEDWIKSGAKAD